MQVCYLCSEHFWMMNTPATHICHKCEEIEKGSGYLCDRCEERAKTIQIYYDNNEIIYEHPHKEEHPVEKLVCEICDYYISVCAKAQIDFDCLDQKRDEYRCRCGWQYSECVCIGNSPMCKPEKRCSKCEWPCAYCVCIN